MIREWVEVPYVPARQYEQKDAQPYRYLAVRVRRQQGDMFADGVKVRHFAMVTNIWDMDGQELLDPSSTVKSDFGGFSGTKM